MSALEKDVIAGYETYSGYCSNDILNIKSWKFMKEIGLNDTKTFTIMGSYDRIRNFFHERSTLRVKAHRDASIYIVIRRKGSSLTPEEAVVNGLLVGLLGGEALTLVTDTIHPLVTLSKDWISSLAVNKPNNSSQKSSLISAREMTFWKKSCEFFQEFTKSKTIYKVQFMTIPPRPSKATTVIDTKSHCLGFQNLNKQGIRLKK